MAPNLSALIASPAYFPLRFNGSDLLFVRMSRSSYHDSIFTLPGRIVTAGTEAWSVPFADVVSLVEKNDPALAPAGFIFQIAHCGSTLLSRALDSKEHNLVIREPLVLRQFAAAPSGADLAARKRGLNVLLHLLSRPFKSNQPVILKTNVPVNFSIAELLAIAPKLNGVMLHADFDEYLLAILKSKDRRLWAQHVAQELADKIAANIGFSARSTQTLTGAQAAAVLWLAQTSIFSRYTQAHRGFKILNSNTFYTAPRKSVTAANKKLSAGLSDEKIGQRCNGHLFNQHSKLPELEYSNLQRESENKSLMKRHADEIHETREWSCARGHDVNSTFAQGSYLLLN